MQAERAFPELAEVDGLRGRIEGWRQSRPKSRPMPEELWQEASAAAKRLGTGRVARALGLNFEALKHTGHFEGFEGAPRRYRRAGAAGRDRVHRAEWVSCSESVSGPG